VQFSVPQAVVDTAVVVGADRFEPINVWVSWVVGIVGVWLLVRAKWRRR
jgi:hypothetical protein